MSTQSSRSRVTALGCMVLAGGLLLPANAFAQSAARPTPILEAARAAVSRDARLMKERSAAQTADTPAPGTDLRSGSFLKSKAGIVTMLVFGTGVAYAVYSSSNDRIRSTGR